MFEKEYHQIGSFIKNGIRDACSTVDIFINFHLFPSHSINFYPLSPIFIQLSSVVIYFHLCTSRAPVGANKRLRDEQKKKKGNNEDESTEWKPDSTRSIFLTAADQSTPALCNFGLLICQLCHCSDYSASRKLF